MVSRPLLLETSSWMVWVESDCATRFVWLLSFLWNSRCLSMTYSWTKGGLLGRIQEAARANQ